MGEGGLNRLQQAETEAEVGRIARSEGYIYGVACKESLWSQQHVHCRSGEG